MNQRFGLFAFFVLVLLGIMLLLQWLGMKQSDRLYERFNRLERTVVESGTRTAAPASAQSEPPTSSQAQPTTGTVPTAASQAVPGDWLVWHMGSEPSGLNPYTSNDAVSGYVTGEIFEGLLKYDYDTLELKPWLAESYKIADDGLSIYFKLRPGIRFSDNTPITADDVVFSFQTIKNPKIDAPHLANYFADFTDVEKLSDTEVVFKLSRLYFKSLSIAGGMEILPRHIYQFEDPKQFNEMQDNPIGSGPYVFERWDRMREIIIRRNENYWGKKPMIDKMIYKIIIDDMATMQALLKEEIDFMSPTPEQFVTKGKDKTFGM